MRRIRNDHSGKCIKAHQSTPGVKMSITGSRFHIKSPAGIRESQKCLKTYPKCILLDDHQNALGRRARAKRVAPPKCSRKPCESQAGSPTKMLSDAPREPYCKNLKKCIRPWDRNSIRNLFRL